MTKDKTTITNKILLFSLIIISISGALVLAVQNYKIEILEYRNDYLLEDWYKESLKVKNLTLAQEIVTYCEIEYKNKLLLTMVDNIARPKK